MTKILLLGLMAFMASPKPVSIQVSPLFPMKGATIRVTCYVDQRERNRFLDVGIEDENHVVLQQSTVELRGLNSAKIIATSFPKLDCEATRAYCIVSDNIGPLGRASGEFTVQGCN